MSPDRNWNLPAPLTDAVRAALADYPPVVAQVLAARGLTDPAEAARFFRAELPPPDDLGALDDPVRLKDLPETVDRLQHAIRRGERVAIYGDYDTDGVTATALLVQVLSALGANVHPYIPHREDEGYGLNVEALRTLAGQGTRLVVTVDCGVRSLAEAEAARELGLDLVITDHHHPGETLPHALAVINPKQAGDAYFEKSLAGVGLAYKLAQGLVRPLDPRPINGSDVLDLVALGTVADLAPLAGENRRLVRDGLKVANRARRAGLKALLDVSRLRPGGVDAGAIAFALGPRLNAAGRLESALAAYELLTTTDPVRAVELAQQLETQNRERQQLTRETQAEARRLALEADPEPQLLFAVHSGFRRGVVGLAAARLTDEFYRPAVVAAQDAEFTVGSARSIREFHITEALDQCADLLVRHGGHAAAAGFTVRNQHLAELVARLTDIARAQLGGLDLKPALRIDAEVRLSDLTGDLVKALAQFEPCGFGNATPVLAARGLKVVNSRTVGADNTHLKLSLGDGRAVMDAIAFRMGERQARLPILVDVAFHLEVNEWNGEQRLQLNVRDLKASGS